MLGTLILMAVVVLVLLLAISSQKRDKYLFVFFMMGFIGVKAQSLEQIINDKEVFLVDVRTPEEFAQGNVKNSVNIPIYELEYRLNELKDKKNIVVFCKAGIRAGKAEKLLKDKGFVNVHNGKTWQNVNNIIKKGNKK